MPKRGYKQTEEHKRNGSLSRIGKNNRLWKGEEVSYQGLHQWVRRHKPISEVCENCHKSKSRLDAANISGEYKRDINDFKWMCRKCHFKYDGILNLFKSPETQFKKGHKYYGGGWTKGKKRGNQSQFRVKEIEKE